jgi:iron complex transport system substrate-binding protein
MRICSFLPSATEIIYSLGMAGQLQGVTHECDYPPEAKSKPKLTRSLIPSSLTTNSSTIDSSVRERLGRGEGIYEIDFDVLRESDPDIIFTQELCEVCAVSFGEIHRAAQKLARKPKVISLDTFTLKDISEAIRTVGRCCYSENSSTKLIDQLEQRISNVSKLTHRMKKRRVFFIEWIDPIMSGGHWMPELIELAGGTDLLAQHGKNSKRVEWNKVREYAPEVIVIAPCGFEVERAKKEAQLLKKLEGWNDVPAVRTGRVYVADGNAYFSRPGPRIVGGLEILCSLINPELASNFEGRYGSNDYTLFLK